MANTEVGKPFCLFFPNFCSAFFSAQTEALDFISKSINDVLREESRVGGKTLFVLSAYKLGKERVLLHVAKSTGLKIYVDENKMKVLNCLQLLPDEMECFTTDPRESPIHVCRMGKLGEMWPFFRPNFVNAEEYLDGVGGGYTNLLGFIPTGWADSSNYNKRNALRSRGRVSIQVG